MQGQDKKNLFILKKCTTFAVSRMITYLSLGSNIGDRHHHIDEACRSIETGVGHIVRRSGDYYSRAWGYESEHEYLNICLAVDTSLTPDQLLLVTQQIERELGRTVKGIYQDRTIDIDILLYFNEAGESVVCQTETLTLPHPRMQEREFVMVPLREIQNNERN